MPSLKTITSLKRFMNYVASVMGFQKDSPKSVIDYIGGMVYEDNIKELENYIEKLKSQKQNIAIMINLPCYCMRRGPMSNVLELAQNPKMLDYLVSLGADITCELKNQNVLLDAFQEEPVMVKHLIELGIATKWDSQPKFPVSMLQKLLLYELQSPTKYLPIIDILLKQNTRYASLPFPGGQTPLSFAVVLGLPQVVKKLLEYGASPYDTDNEFKQKNKKLFAFEHAPLISALQINNEEIVDILLSTATNQEKLNQFIQEIECCEENEKMAWVVDYQEKINIRQTMFSLSQKVPYQEEKNKAVFKM